MSDLAPRALLTSFVVALMCWGLMWAISPELLPAPLGGAVEAAPAAVQRLTRALPSSRARDHLSLAIADRLTYLGVRPADVITSESARLDTPAGPWPVEALQLYLPNTLVARRVVSVLASLESPPGATLSWRSSETPDLRMIIEARLDRVPTHVIELVPDLPPPAPRSAPRPPQLALIIQGVGDSWAPVDRLLSLDGALSFAITPFSPYALEWAERAHSSRKQVWVDWSGRRREELPPFDRLASVPYARGVYVAGRALADVKAIDALLNLSLGNHLALLSREGRAAKRGSAQGVLSGVPMRIEAGGHWQLERELNRYLTVAVHDGAAIAVISPRAQDLGMLVSWLIDVQQQGYELALATDAMRHLQP